MKRFILSLVVILSSTNLFAYYVSEKDFTSSLQCKVDSMKAQNDYFEGSKSRTSVRKIFNDCNKKILYVINSGDYDVDTYYPEMNGTYRDQYNRIDFPDACIGWSQT